MQTLLQNLLNGIAAGSIYALIALGYTMVYGILKLINFAHGDIFMLGAFAGYYAGNWFVARGASSYASAAIVLLLSMIVCGMFGFINERIAYRPLRNSPRIASLITAIGVSFFLEYGGQMVFGADPKFFPTLIPKKIITFGGITTTNYQLIVLVVALVFMALLQYIVYGTKFGRAAVAGILYGLAYPKIDPLMGIMPGLKAFVAAVLGGIGNVPGAVVGGLVIGVIEAFVGGSQFSNYRDAIAFVILIVILLFKPSGLFGKYQPEKV
jgi:branched-chain amino acid transport system permease protein